MEPVWSEYTDRSEHERQTRIDRVHPPHLLILAIPQLSTCTLFHPSYIVGSSQRAWIKAALKTYTSLTVLNSSLEVRAFACPDLPDGLLLGEKATEKTELEWPLSVCSAAPITAALSCCVTQTRPAWCRAIFWLSM